MQKIYKLVSHILIFIFFHLFSLLMTKARRFCWWMLRCIMSAIFTFTMYVHNSTRFCYYSIFNDNSFSTFLFPWHGSLRLAGWYPNHQDFKALITSAFLYTMQNKQNPGFSFAMSVMDPFHTHTGLISGPKQLVLVGGERVAAPGWIVHAQA